MNAAVLRALEVIRKANPDEISIVEEGNRMRIEVALDEILPKKGKGAYIVQQMRKSNCLHGMSEESNAVGKEFRQNFSFER